MLIAEIGLNHLGSEKKLMSYLECLNGVDAITLQVLSEDFYTGAYSKFALDHKTIKRFLIQARFNGFKVGLVTDDIEKITKYKRDVNFFKILSKDLINVNLLDHIYSTEAEKIYLSTGMSDFKYLDALKDVGYFNDPRIGLIHTQLSNSSNDVNLKAIATMRKRYEIPISYGHHCKVLETIYTSLAFEPESIFFYIKDSENCEFPDDAHAFSVDHLQKIINNFREIRYSLGDGVKKSMENWR